MGAEATGMGGMEATGMGGMEVGGIEATGGEALGSGSASALDRSGGRIGGHTGADTGDLMPMATPMPTRPSSPCRPPESMCNPQHRPRGITVTTHRGITPTCSNVRVDGEPWPPRRHKPEAAGPRAHHPARLSSVPRCDRGI
jgi:hypothetical protein